MLYLHNTVLPNEDKNYLIRDVLKLFNAGDLNHNSPEYQTFAILFDRPESHWVNLKKSFLDATLGTARTNLFEVESWAYINIPNHPIFNHKDTWHTHKSPYEKYNRVISGIFYLNFPEGSNTTQFLINNDIKTIPFNPNCWILFPGFLYHRPGEWDYNVAKEPRIVIGADLYF